MTDVDPKYCSYELHLVDDDQSREVTHLKQNKHTTKKECNCFCSLLNEYASAQTTDSAKSELVIVDG